MIYKNFTILLKEKRLKLNLKQKDMANLLQISISKYNKIENGSLEPSFYELYIITKTLKIDLTSYFNNIKFKDFMNYD